MMVDSRVPWDAEPATLHDWGVYDEGETVVISVQGMAVSIDANDAIELARRIVAAAERAAL